MGWGEGERAREGRGGREKKRWCAKGMGMGVAAVVVVVVEEKRTTTTTRRRGD